MKPAPSPLRTLLLQAITFLATAMLSANAARPNMVILLADDAGWGDFGFTGNRSVQTPNIDRIAAEGLQMPRFYVCPVCSPTRAELLTGRYYPRTGVKGVSLGQERLNLDESTLANHLQAVGYTTGIFGKWHNGSQWPYHPNARGFHHFFGYTAGHWGEYFNPELETNGKLSRKQGYIVDLCTDAALQFIEKNQANPFLCYIPFTTPHSPWSAPAHDWDRWKHREINQKATRPEAEIPDETRCALAMIENQDANIGRILRKLDDLNLTQNTIVIFFSDNGPNTHRWNGGLKGKKGDTDEGGVRSPFAVRWPGRIPASTKIQDLSGAIDLTPTLLSLSGTKLQPDKDKPLDGIDLSNRWIDPASPPIKRQLISHWAGKTAIREDALLLDASGALFDITQDPAQRTNLAASQPDTLKRLSTAVETWKRECRITQSSQRNRDTPPDERPFTVGYREFPTTILPARDGTPLNGLKRSSNAPNSSFFTGWSDRQHAAIWPVQIHEPGEYRVILDLTAPTSSVPIELQLELEPTPDPAHPDLSNHRLINVLQDAWDPPLNTDQDTLPRPKAESQLKPFKSWTMGNIYLPEGRALLKLHAPKLSTPTGIDLRRITLELSAK